MAATASRSTALLAVACLALAACGGADASPTAAGAEDDRLAVVATTSIHGDVVRSIVGDDGTVETLMGPGVDPHAFSPSAQQAQAIREADLVVANGLQLEESLVDTLEAAEQDGARVLYVGEEMDPLPFGDGGGHDDGEHDDEAAHDDEEHDDEGEASRAEGDEHDHGPLDPHVWLDPTRMAEGATVIAAALAEVDDALDDAEWEQRGQDRHDELVALDAEVAGMLDAIPEQRRQLVTNHDAFGYFADRYGFEVVGTVIPGSSTQVDTSAAAFDELAQLIAAQDVPAIFSEATSSDDLASALAEEVGRDVAIVQLYSGALGDEGSGASTYDDLVRFDAQAIADALA